MDEDAVELGQQSADAPGPRLGRRALRPRRQLARGTPVVLDVRQGEPQLIQRVGDREGDTEPGRPSEARSPDVAPRYPPPGLQLGRQVVDLGQGAADRGAVVFTPHGVAGRPVDVQLGGRVWAGARAASNYSSVASDCARAPGFASRGRTFMGWSGF